MILLLFFSVLRSSVAIDLSHVDKSANKFMMKTINGTTNERTKGTSLLDQELCSPTCLTNNIDCTSQRNSPFYTINGRCNNLQNPFWGNNDIEFIRMVPSNYPTFSGFPPEFTNNVTRNKLPNSRLVSRTMSFRPDASTTGLTHLVMHIGQFIDHDVTLTPEGPNCVTECPPIEEECCHYVEEPPANADDIPSVCWPIVDDSVPANDPGHRCMEFVRTSLLQCDVPGIQSDEQFNGITAFLDAGNVYSSDAAVNSAIRDSGSGLLASNPDHPGLLPFAAAMDVPPQCPASEDVQIAEFQDFIAGDVRANEIPGLQSMHTLWFREHNRIAGEILAGGETNSELVYQRARRLVIAEYQNIIYSEWLPIILGRNLIQRYSLDVSSRTTYDPNVRPGMRNGFATAAFRFGHTLVSGSIRLFDRAANEFLGSRALRNSFFTTQLLLEGNFENVLGGMLTQGAEDFNNQLADDLTNFLFRDVSTDALGSDLFARNIQRGRDHGLGSYQDFRARCELDPLPNSFSDDPPADVDPIAWARYPSIFDSPLDIGLFTGGLGEVSVDGGLVGPTLGCVIGLQFFYLLAGDRLFFSHPEQGGVGLSDQEFAAARSRTFRDVFCDNTDISFAQPDIFRRPGAGNEVVACATGAHSYP